MKKLIAFMAALMVMMGYFSAVSEESKDLYVLMTIPYSLFYEAETTGGQYDSVSSATRVKPRMGTYVGGSFHYMKDGREITGVIFPVHIPDESMLAALGSEEITDNSSVTITVTDNGKKVTATYTGRDALFESFPFSYYRLDEVPPVYKELTGESSFGPMQGLTLAVDGDVSLVTDPHAQVCLEAEGLDEILSSLNVNGAVLVAGDGTRAGMKHLENIWQKVRFGFNYDSEVYGMLKGKTLAAVEFYTLEARYVVNVREALTIH